MSRLHRMRRRAGHSTAAHARARGLAATRLGDEISLADTLWLNEHLSSCEACRAVAAAYEADRDSLRSFLGHQPEAPRDLWARTAAALDRESATRGGAPRRSDGRSSRSGPVLGLVSGVAVMAVVLGASILSGGFGGSGTARVPGPSTPILALASATAPGPTPIVVGAGSVGWVGTSSDGELAYNVTPITQVCPADRQPDCAPVTDNESQRVQIAIRPKSISQSPVRNQAVVVGTDAQGADSVLVIALPTARPTAKPSPTATVAPSATPSRPPATTEPPATVGPPASPKSTPEPTPTPSVEATPTVGPSDSPILSTEPSAAETVAIVTGVKVVGESAAYSPDGAWFAFTARPSDDSVGPDIYLWHVGDPLALPLTHDHGSVFGSWAGNLVLGSRATTTPVASGDPTATPVASADATVAVDVAPQSFFLDPATGLETPIAVPVWRPIVDPAGDRAVAWAGTVKLGDDGLTTSPATGSLVLRGFTPNVGPDQSGVADAVVAEGPMTEYDVRWDETGTWLAVWVADATDPSIGRLSLMHLDRETGRLDRPAGAPQDVTALPGFSIADSRLAWATPPGQGGEGSRVQIVAWTDNAVGAVESTPVEGVVVVH